MIFSRRSPPEGQAGKQDAGQTQYSSLQGSGEGLEAEYEEIVRLQLARLGVPLETVAVEVRPAGVMQDGRHIYLGMVRLVQWDRRSSLRLLVALPLLEAKTRQSLDTTWLIDVSSFGGLWVHASSGLRTNDVLHEIRDAVMQLELGMKTSEDGRADAAWSASVQAELGEDITRSPGSLPD